VPPPPDGLPDLLRDWERFANEGAEMPLLIQNALLHSQVEMIRPFSTATDASDGCCWCSASSPAAGFLRRCSTGARTSSAIASATTPRSSPCWRQRRVPWIEMFFIAVKIQASDAMSRAERTIELRERYRGMAATMETATGWRWSTRCARTRW